MGSRELCVSLNGVDEDIDERYDDIFISFRFALSMRSLHLYRVASLPRTSERVSRKHE